MMPARIMVNSNCPVRGQLSDLHEMCHSSLTWHVDLTGMIKISCGQSDAYLLKWTFALILYNVKCLPFLTSIVLLVLHLVVSHLIQEYKFITKNIKWKPRWFTLLIADFCLKFSLLSVQNQDASALFGYKTKKRVWTKIISVLSFICSFRNLLLVDFSHSGFGCGLFL